MTPSLRHHNVQFSLGLMRFTLLIYFIVMLQTATAKHPSMPVVSLTAAEAAALGAYTPRPEYPLEARRNRITGNGVFLMDIDIPSGIVQNVTIEHSTGSRILDAAVVSTFTRWRFKPQRLRSLQQRDAPWEKAQEMGIRVPVTFVMRKT